MLSNMFKPYKKLWCLSAVAAMALALLSGCGEAAAAAASSEQTAESQLGENQTMLLGKIAEIAGNEITLALAQANVPGASGWPDIGASGRQEGNGNFERPDGDFAPDGEMPEGGFPQREGQGDGDASRPGRQNGDASRPAGGRGENGQGRNGGNRGGFGGQGGGGFNLTYTGETQTITIPVGIKVTSGWGENTTEIDFTKLAVDNILRVVVETTPSGGQAVVSVQLVQ